MKRRKFIFKNHGTTLKIRKHAGGFVFYEAHLPYFGEKLYKDYETAFKKMQTYSRKYYGERAI